VDIPLTMQVPAVPGFVPELTIQTTLRDNPCLPEEDEDDEDEWMPDLAALFESFLQEPPRHKPASQRKTGGQAASRQPLPAADRPTPVPPMRANLVYSLEVSLTDGPVSAAHANRKIARRIDILGRQTLHELHQAIFEAFERWDQHLYEFNLGEGPGDRSQLYFYTGGGDASDDETTGDPTTTPLAALNLEVGRLFGYTFDMGDQWEHLIEVVATAEARGTVHYPRITKKVGKAPPQYPDDDADV
jgi:hypothetical protein